MKKLILAMILASFSQPCFAQLSAAQTQAMLNSFARRGYTINPDNSVTKPNGTVLPASSFQSPQAMIAAGFSAAEVRSIQSETGIGVAQQTQATSSSGSMNENAGSAKTMQLIGAATNAGTSAAFFSICSTPTGQWACVPGALSAAQAAAQLFGAGGASRTKDATNYGLNGSGTGGSNCAFVPCTDTNGDGVPDTPVDTTSGFGSGNATDGSLFNSVSGQTQGLLSAYEKKGYKVNDDGTVTTPSGQKVSGASFSSPSAMSDFGMTASQIEDMQNIMAAGARAGADRARAVAIETEGGGGGGFGAGGGGANARKTASAGGAGFDFSKLFGDKNKKGAKNGVGAGLSRKLGTDSIGVASDNIFEMMSRQYRKQETNQEFMPAASLAPAAGKQVQPRKPSNY